MPPWSMAVLWLVAMLPLAFWGLPSSDLNPLLFDGPAWEADRYGAAKVLQQRRDRVGGADTDVDPLAADGRIVHLTASAADRGAILRRYRLFSRQPDEMITFMALQRMNPPDLDPRLYQYGGAWVYLVGAAMAAGSVVGLVEISSDAGVYLERPELFARFYVVARLISLVFGGLLLIAVHKLAARAAGRRAGWIAMLLAACCPVFITGALEAKPHLASACLLLFAALYVLRYVERGRPRDAIGTGITGGLAMGFVLTGFVALILWPAALFAKRGGRARPVWQLGLAAALAMAVYVVTNPYVVYNALFDSDALWGNIDNSTAMYSVARPAAGALRVGELLLEGCGPGVVIFGLIGLAALLRRHARQTLLVAAPALVLLAICVAIGAGKPAEYARFLLLPGALLAVCSATLLAGPCARYRLTGWLALIVMIAVSGAPACLRAFAADAEGTAESRSDAARYLLDRMGAGDALAVLQEPAPYAVPPVDFATREVYLLPERRPAALDPLRLPAWLTCTADDDTAYADAWWRAHYTLDRRFPEPGTWLSPIAWANKPVYVYRRVP